MNKNPAYFEGMEARKSGEKIGANPYCVNERGHFDWLEGWVKQAKKEKMERKQ